MIVGKLRVCGAAFKAKDALAAATGDRTTAQTGQLNSVVASANWNKPIARSVPSPIPGH
jgi:hypothetical protein